MSRRTFRIDKDGEVRVHGKLLVKSASVLTPLAPMVLTPAPSDVILSTDIAITWGFAFTKIGKGDTEEERIVEGWATADVRDLQGDRIPYEVAKAAFEKYFSTIGIREMHQPIAVGRLDKWWGDDAGRRIGIQCFISRSRDGEDVWTKVGERILRAFSVGGRALDWKYDASERIITNMQLTEISLVDVPANPQAVITLYKANAAELAAFNPKGGDMSNRSASVAAMAAAAQTAQIVAGALLSKAPVPSVPNAQPIAQVPPIESDPGAISLIPPAFAPPPPAGLVQLPVQQQLTAYSWNGDKPPAVVAPGVPANRPTAASGRPLAARAIVKDVGNAPNLRQADESAMARCGNCEYFRYMNEGYCRAFDFKAQYEWVCDYWQMAGVSSSANEPPAAQQMADPSVAPSSGQTLQDAGRPAVPPPSTQSNPVITAPTTGSTIADAGRPTVPPPSTSSDPVITAPTTGSSIAARAAQDLNDLGARVGIVRKADAPASPAPTNPKDWRLYGDPANWAWPVDRVRVPVTVLSYNRGVKKSRYSAVEWSILGRRIARIASQVSPDADYVYDALDKSIARKEKKMATPTLDATLQQVRASVAAAMESMDSDPSRAKDMLTQVCAAIDVAGDAAGGQGGSTATITPPKAAGGTGTSPSTVTGAATPTPTASTPTSSSPTSSPTSSSYVAPAGADQAQTNETLKAILSLADTVAKLASTVAEMKGGTTNVSVGRDRLAADPAAQAAVNKGLNGAPAGDVPNAAPAQEFTPLQKAILQGNVAEALKQANGDMGKVLETQEDIVKQAMGASGISMQRYFMLNQFPQGAPAAVPQLQPVYQQ